MYIRENAHLIVSKTSMMEGVDLARSTQQINLFRLKLSVQLSIAEAGQFSKFIQQPREKCTVQTERERARNGKKSPVDGCCMQDNKIRGTRQNAVWTSVIKSKRKGKKQLVVIAAFGLYVCCFLLLGGRSLSFFAADRACWLGGEGKRRAAEISHLTRRVCLLDLSFYDYSRSFWFTD